MNSNYFIFAAGVIGTALGFIFGFQQPVHAAVPSPASWLGAPITLADGKQMYVGIRNGKFYGVLGTKVFGPFDGLTGDKSFYVSKNKTASAFAVGIQKAGTCCPTELMIINGKKTRNYGSVSVPQISDDGSFIAFLADSIISGKELLVSGTPGSTLKETEVLGYAPYGDSTVLHIIPGTRHTLVTVLVPRLQNPIGDLTNLECPAIDGKTILSDLCGSHLRISFRAADHIIEFRGLSNVKGGVRRLSTDTLLARIR